MKKWKPALVTVDKVETTPVGEWLSRLGPSSAHAAWQLRGAVLDTATAGRSGGNPRSCPLYDSHMHNLLQVTTMQVGAVLGRR